MVPSKQNAAHPGKADLLASRATASAGRNEENWFPEKRALQSPRSVALRFPGRTDIEGDEEKWFRKKPTKKS
jgi:hypothetical protein